MLSDTPRSPGRTGMRIVPSGALNNGNHARSIAYRMGVARFPLVKTLANFDFACS
jgi:hypothetical protein